MLCVGVVVWDKLEKSGPEEPCCYSLLARRGCAVVPLLVGGCSPKTDAVSSCQPDSGEGPPTLITNNATCQRSTVNGQRRSFSPRVQSIGETRAALGSGWPPDCFHRLELRALVFANRCRSEHCEGDETDLAYDGSFVTQQAAGRGIERTTGITDESKLSLCTSQIS